MKSRYVPWICNLFAVLYCRTDNDDESNCEVWHA